MDAVQDEVVYTICDVCGVSMPTKQGVSDHGWWSLWIRDGEQIQTKHICPSCQPGGVAKVIKEE